MTAKLLIIAGCLILGVGLALQFAPGLFGWFGRLPGDISFQRGGLRVFIPLTSMVVVSVLLTLILNLLLRR